MQSEHMQWSSRTGFVQTQVQTTHGLHTTGPSHALFLSIPHLAAVQLPSPKHSSAHFVWFLKALPQIPKNFTYLFSLSLSHSN